MAMMPTPMTTASDVTSSRNQRSIGSASYTEESFAALQEAIEAGNAVLLNENAKLAEVDAARTAIYDAIDALAVRPADYTELYQLISIFEALSPDLYTPESYAAVQQAVNNVVYGLPYSEQASVDAMAQSISHAMEQLAERKRPHLTPAAGSGAVVDNEHHLIYGISPGTEALQDQQMELGTVLRMPPTCEPQLGQKPLPSGTVLPQLGQGVPLPEPGRGTRGCCTGPERAISAPQLVQNIAPLGMLAPQLLQFMVGFLLLYLSAERTPGQRASAPRKARNPLSSQHSVSLYHTTD